MTYLIDNPPDNEADMWAQLKPLQEEDLLEDVRPEFKIVGEVLSEYSYQSPRLFPHRPLNEVIYLGPDNLNFIQKSVGIWQLNSNPFGWRCVMADMDYDTEGEDCKDKLFDHIHDLLWHF